MRNERYQTSKVSRESGLGSLFNFEGTKRSTKTKGKLEKMGSQLRWLERTPDKREVGGSSPLEPTKKLRKNFLAQVARGTNERKTQV